MKQALQNYSISLRWLCSAALLSLVMLLASCEDHRVPSPGQGIQPTGPKPAYAPNITPQMLAVIEELGRLNPVPLYKLSPQEARTKPTFKDAVNSLLDKNKIVPPIPKVTKTERMIPGAGGVPIRAVIYTPAGAAASAPVIVYYHGGGWVIGNTEVYEYSILALAQNTGAIVVSVDYRLAPENKFPTAHEDSYAAYRWVKENAATIGGNPAKVALAGESAGGNLAVSVSM
ncbi:MAG TPA: alpha/beta hydrolase fold domain-containing protein, partial [Fibrella sp.]